MFLMIGLILSALAGVAHGNCPDGQILANHDGSFESGYGWDYFMEEPDYGSFAEGFRANGQVCGVAVYLTCAMGLALAVPDFYVWSALDGNPGEVLAMVPSVYIGPVGFWPHVTRHEVDIEATVIDSFFVGIWPFYYDTSYFVAADLTGPGGVPRTKVPPGQEWPPGWHHPDEIWHQGTKSLGFEAIVMPAPTPVARTSWGRIKEMFR